MSEADEFAKAAEIAGRFGSLEQAFALVKRGTGAEDRDAIVLRSTVDSWR